jgi:hypothetical protein
MKLLPWDEEGRMDLDGHPCRVPHPMTRTTRSPRW